MWLCRVFETKRASAVVCVSIASVCKEKLSWLQLWVFMYTNPHTFTDSHSFESFNQGSQEQEHAKPAVGQWMSSVLQLTALLYLNFVPKLNMHMQKLGQRLCKKKKEINGLLTWKKILWLTCCSNHPFFKATRDYGSVDPSMLSNSSFGRFSLKPIIQNFPFP